MNAPRGAETFIGPYRILRRVGEGGMGIVYEAEQSSPVRRHVALKVLRPGLADSGLVTRFEAERQALAMMGHPGIARVFDAGTAEDGRPYFAMELVGGLPLTEYADRHRLPLEARIRLFVTCCRAVHHAHQKGIIHRDLKPSNILVTEADGEPRPKIIDFGIAKALGFQLTDETLVTRFGSTLGTPAYMSPEQADGTDFGVDVRTDVYSLGVILYELLVGSLPADPRDLKLGRFLADLLDEDTETPRPSTRFRTLPEAGQAASAHARATNPARLRRRLSGDLDWIVMTSLEKDPARRYDSARALGDDLDRYLRHEPVSARPPGLAYRIRKFVRRNRLAVAAASIVVLALVAGSVASTVGFVRASREAEVARRVSDFLTAVFSEADPSTSRGAEVTVREMLDRAATQIRTELAGEPLVQGRLMMKIGEAYRALGLLDRAQPLLEAAVERLEEGGAAPLELSEARHELAFLFIFRTDFDRAEPLMRQVWETRRSRLGDGDGRTAQALNNLVFLFLRSGSRFAQGDSLLRAALPVQRAALGPEDEMVGLTLYHLCWALRGEGRLLEADSVCTQALDLRRGIYGGDHPQIGYTLLMLAHTRRELGQYAASLEAAREVLAMNRRLYPGDHSETSYALRTVAAAWAALGRPDSAFPYAVEAEAMFRRMVDSTNSERTSSLIQLGDVLTGLRRFDGAEAAYREALAVDSGKFGRAHPRVAEVLMHSATMEMQRGRFKEADLQGRRALEIVRGLEVPDEPAVLRALLVAGEASYRLGDAARAESRLREALERASGGRLQDPLRLATARVELARVLTDRGGLDEACPLAEAGLADRKTQLPPGHGSIGVAETVLGRCLARAGRAAEAEVHLRAARELLEERPAEDLFRRDAFCDWAPAPPSPPAEGAEPDPEVVEVAQDRHVPFGEQAGQALAGRPPQEHGHVVGERLP